MDDSPSQYLRVSDGLIRQRRNLVLSSIAFLLVCLGGARIGVVSIGIGTITFDRPSVIYLALWIAELYFLLRYLQYLGSEQQLLESSAKLYGDKADSYLNKRFREAIN